MVHTVVGKMLGLVYIFFALSTLLFNESIRLNDKVENKIERQIALVLVCFMLSLACWLYLLNQSHMEHMKYLHEIYQKILAQSESNYIVNRLEESIVIVNEISDRQDGQSRY